AVATLGTALTPNQARLLKNLASRVVLVYDADAAGQKAAIRALPLLLKEDLVVDILLLPSGDDPDSFVQREGGEAFLQLLHHAQPLLDWYLKKGEEETKADLNQRYQFLQEAISIISLFKNPLMQSHYQDKICQLFSIEPSLLATLTPPQAHSLHRQDTPFISIESMPAFEKNIIKFILSYPEYLSWFIKEDILQEVKHPLLHSLLEKIVKFYEEHNTVDVNGLIMDIEESLKKLITRWSIEEGEYDKPEEIAQGFLRLLRERQFKRLLKAIKEAEIQGDWQRLSVLLRQKNELACDLKRN
ncbi:MAG: toprim domain-containing protein, partial [Candidatus Desulfofervidaceae bacterium]|nr:toprim domain-containing protein [Candidatus Desulfofervidaceae bacterium]